MKRILSISVGSSSRDHATTHVFLGQECELSRQGTDGDFDKAVQRYYDLDGKVDPAITRMPFMWFYPLGSEQDKPPYRSGTNKTPQVTAA